MVPISYRPEAAALTTISRRIIEALLTAWAALTVTFFSHRLAAGDPIASLISQGLATPAQAEALRERLGFDRSLWVQYWDFLSGFFRGDLGLSLYSRRPVHTVILEQFPATAELALASLFFALVAGVTLGILASWYRKDLRGDLAGLLAGMAMALPVASTGVLILIAYSLLVQGFPGMSLDFNLQRLALPTIVLGFASSGPIAKVLKASLDETLAAPYILADRVRGYRRDLRLLWHALRPALPATISLIGLEAAFLFAGTVVTETVFSRPGLGRLLIRSILQGDFPVAQGIVALAAIFYTVSHLLADLLAVAIDPRLRRDL